MKKVTLSIMFLLSVIVLKAQNKNAMVTETTLDSGKIVFTSVEKAPEFPGGLQEFYKFLGSTISIPKLRERIIPRAELSYNLLLRETDRLLQ